MFDDYLRERSRKTGEPFVPFDPVADYDEYVDGKPRADGTRSFLESRGIHLPEGSDDDPPTAETVHGLGNRKNEIVLRKIRKDGVEAYPGSVAYLRAVKEAGLPRAVVSPSSSTCAGSRPRTRTWPGRRPSGSSRPPRACSRTRWPAWPPGGPASSGSWSAS